MLNHVFRPLVRNPSLFTDEFKKRRRDIVLNVLATSPNTTIKQHCDFLIILYEKVPDIATTIMAQIDKVYRLERRNKFEFMLSRILWAKSGQHGDEKRSYNLETYPTIHIDPAIFEVDMDNLIHGENLMFDRLTELGVHVSETIYYEDFLGDTSPNNAIKAPDKSKYITNYFELKERFDVYD